MAFQRVLFIGATGNLGAPVAAQMLRAGYRVRALVRDPARAAADPRLAGAELVPGDVLDRASVAAAMQGCGAAYSNLSGASFELADSTEYRGIRTLCELAREQQLAWLGSISGAGDLAAANQLRPLAVKAACERAVAESGVPWTLFKPSHFFESLPMFVRAGRIAIPGRQPHRYHYLAAQDYARVVVAAMADSGCHHRRLTLHGPEVLTMAEALAIFRDARYPGARVGTMPLWLMRLLGRVSGNTELARVAELFATFQAHGDDGIASELPAGFPALTTTCRQWCAQPTEF